MKRGCGFSPVFAEETHHTARKTALSAGAVKGNPDHESLDRILIFIFGYDEEEDDADGRRRE
jgi:hypothetical protein